MPSYDRTTNLWSASDPAEFELSELLISMLLYNYAAMGWDMCRSSEFRRTIILRGTIVLRRTIVQLYDSSKTQNAHNFGLGYATDP